MIDEIIAHLSAQQYDEARTKINQILHKTPKAYVNDFDTALILVQEGTVICDTNTAKELWLTVEEQETLPWEQTTLIPFGTAYTDKPNLQFYIDPLFPAHRILYINKQTTLLKLNTKP